MKSREKKLLKLTIGILILVGVYALFIDPLLNWLSDERVEAQRISARFENFQADLIRMGKLDESCNKYKEKLGNSEIDFGLSSEVIAAIGEVNKVLSQGGISVKNLRPGPVEKPRGKKLQSMVLYVSGSTRFDKLIKTLHSIETAKIACNPLKVDVTKKDEKSDQLNVDLQIEVYLYAPGNEPPPPEASTPENGKSGQKV